MRGALAQEFAQATGPTVRQEGLDSVTLCQLADALRVEVGEVGLPCAGRSFAGLGGAGSHGMPVLTMHCRSGRVRLGKG